MLVVVARRSAVGREPHRADAAPGVGEGGGENRAVAGELMVVAELLLDGELEVIARLQFRGEVDVATEDVGELSVQYLNRLSDALFVWGRWCALKDGKAEPLWDSRTT